MYKLSEKQIDFILDDIRARGVEMEDLQLNLLDHVCCIVEQHLEEQGDFDAFYQTTIRSFYKEALWEIEEETLSLLTFKHYYTMKKLMIISGAISVSVLCIGIAFKYLHWPGASFMLAVGILAGSLIFLPLLFTLKAKEKQSAKDKWVMGLGALGVILVSLSFLFRVMHWPFAIDMMYLSAAVMLLVFLPLYFFAGIRRPDTKLNTITTSMLVILVYGLLFLGIRTPQSALYEELKAQQEFGIGLQILMNEQKLAADAQKNLNPEIKVLNEQVYQRCNELKTQLAGIAAGNDTIEKTQPLEFDSNRAPLSTPFRWDENTRKEFVELASLVNHYNTVIEKTGSKRISRIPVKATVLDQSTEVFGNLSKANVMNQLTHIQMFVLQNSRALQQVNT